MVHTVVRTGAKLPDVFGDLDGEAVVEVAGEDEDFLAELVPFIDEHFAFVEKAGPGFLLVLGRHHSTGDLHNSFAIKITENVWEFCSGPHNSVNHVPLNDEMDRPATGIFDWGPRKSDIRWSSYILPDLPRLERLYPHFCIVQVNTVFNMPQKLGEKRLVAYPHPQVVFQYYNGRTGELAYAEAISVDR